MKSALRLLERAPLLGSWLKGRAAKVRFLGAILILIVVGIGYSLFSLLGGSSQASWSEYEVELIPVEASIKQRGILRSSKVVPTEVNVRGTIQEIIPDGSVVKKGDTLFVMDGNEREMELDNRLLAVDRDKLSLKSAEALLVFTEFKESKQLDLLKAKLGHAQLTQTYELGIPHADELRNLEINKQLAEFDLQDAESDFERNKRLLDKGFISESALEPYELRVNTARVYLEEIKLEIKIKKKGIPDERRVELKRAVERAESDLKRYETRVERSLALIRADIETIKRRIEVAQFEVDIIEDELARVKTVAQVDGVFRVGEYRDWRMGGRKMKYKAGVDKYARNVIGEIIDPSNMKINLAINEADLSRVREGQEAKVQIPAIPNKTFKGKVTLIGSIGRDRNQIDPTAKGNNISGVVSYNATVTFDGEGILFNPGMSALVSIITEPENQELVIPRAALVFEEDKVCVYKKGVFGVKKSEITGRVFNENYFKVTSGVSEGEVVLMNYRETTDG